MNKAQAKEKIKELMDRYKDIVESGKVKTYNEEETKIGFILPLFEILGWDAKNKSEVSAEESMKSRDRVDFGFYLDGMIKFYLETKALKVDLQKEEYERQAIRYSWHKGVNWAILTNFESIKVYNAMADSKLLIDKLVFEITWREYIADFDRLWLFSRESFEQNALDKYAEKYGKKQKKLTVNEKLYDDLKKAREILTKSFKEWNNDLDQETLDEGVQRILDRLVFIRVLEDKGLEPPTLRQIVNEHKKVGDSNKQLFPVLIDKFRELDGIYDSNLFSKHACEDWEEYDGAIEKVIALLYGSGIHEYDFKEIPADILGGVYESYLGYIAQNPITIDKSGKSGKLFNVEDKKELKEQSRVKRKEQGIFYTPKFIVEYIVKNTLGEKLKEINNVHDLKKIKILDPACGSGSFLTKALEAMNDKYKDFGYRGDQLSKSQILLENIYGVDLDAQAVELAKLNLLIDALDKKEKLPDLTSNIRVGNSLISGDEKELEKYFGKNWRDKRPFNWEENFSEVFKQGGFDVIIGNPPYVNLANIKDENERNWLKDKYETAKNKSDLYSFFTERATKLLKEDGVLGFIFSNSWLGTDSFSKFREYLINNFSVYEMVKLPAGVFKDALVTTILLFLKKKKPKENHQIKLLEYKENRLKNIGYLSYERVKKAPNFSFSFNEEISFNTPTINLEEIAKFSLGIKTSDDERFLSDNKKDENSFKLLRGKDVNRYNYKYANKWIWYKPELMMEKVGAGPRKLEYFLKDKILFRSITGGSIISTIDTEKYLVNDKVHVLYDLSDYSMQFILGIVNSKLINSWIKSSFNDLLEIKINQLQKIPIPKIDFSNKTEKQKHDELAKLADKMIELNKQSQNIPENSDKWNNIKKEIEKTDKEIDKKVYELYGLTEEEIKVVESN